MGKKEKNNILNRWFKRKANAQPSNDEVVQPGTGGLAPIAYNPYLLENARTQWQFGDWKALTQLAEQPIEHHPDRATLALLAAAGFMQLGDMYQAKHFLSQCESWGQSRHLISQIMISGVHNSLGRTSELCGQQSRARQHFEMSVATGMPSINAILLGRARHGIQKEQLDTLDIPIKILERNQLRLFAAAPSPSTTPRFQLKKRIDLGDAWAGNTINTVIFRHHGIMTVGEHQYTAFYVDRNTMRLVRRFLSDDSLQVHDIAGEYNLKDAHNSISLGMDREGRLHISYDHHATQLKYRRSKKSHDISEWTDELPMTGQNEERVTYPTFILPRQGFPLTLLYRNGTHDCGTAFIKTYDEANQIWQDHPKPILSGADQKPWTANGYWNNPVVGEDGSLHLSFVWRTHTLGEEKRVNNINVGYAKSFDNGLTWWTSNNQSYRLPITPTNAETIWPVSPGSNLINQCSMALDSHQRPHIVFYSNHPINLIPTFQHLWHNGVEWRHQYLAQSTETFNLQGDGTLQIPISRPSIILDKEDNAHIIYRVLGQENGFFIESLKAPNYYQINVQILEEKVGFSEPIIDHERWTNDRKLTILQQYNHQPNNDLFSDENNKNFNSNLSIKDYYIY